MRGLKTMVSVFGILMWAGLAGAGEPPAGPLQVTNYGTKDAVTFDHSKHSGESLACDRCHHAVEGQEGETAERKCGACHGLEDGKAPRIKEAMHGKDKGVCASCHLDKEAEHRMKCNDCHKG